MLEKLKQFRLKDLKVGIKLAILAILPILGLLYFAIVDITNRWSEFQTASELNRLTELMENIGTFVHESQVERGLSTVFVGSEDTTFGSELQAQRTKADEAAQTLRETIEQIRSDDLDQEFFDRLDQAVTDLDRVEGFRSQVDNLSVSRDEVLEFYTNIHDEFFDTVLFMPRLTRDPELGGSISAYGIFLFEKDAVSEERAIIADILEEGQFSGNAFAEAFIFTNEERVLNELFRDLATSEELALRNELVADSAVAAADQLRAKILAQHDEFGNEVAIDFGITEAEWFAAATAKINILREVDSGLVGQIREITAVDALAARNQLILFGIIVTVLAIVTVAIAVFITRGITGQVTNLTDLFGEIGIGNFGARATALSQDELGEMSLSLNAMLDNILALVQTQDERDQIQGAIMKLLTEISGVADGDLTAQAEVTEDMTGAIADSFNFMIGQLREVIRNVQEATVQVSFSAHEIQTTAEYLSQGSETQASQIVDTSAAVDEMSVSIQQVSENAARSAEVAQTALSNAQQGARVVQETIQSMIRIRDQVEETSKRIARLGESSKEIGDIVQLIGDIADRTSILALNASIQAAMAGEAGQGFAVVAEEVESLADRATEATRQIASIVKTIQSETSETVAAMEDSQRQVVEGSNLADQAGQTLSEIENVSKELAELIQSISMASKQQARGSEAVAQSMNDIADVTQQTAAGTRQAAVSINNLATLADTLRGSVSTFKLPEGSDNGNGRLN